MFAVVNITFWRLCDWFPRRPPLVRNVHCFPSGSCASLISSGGHMRFVGTSLLFCTVLLAAAVPAKADIIFTLGNHPQGDEQNILLNKGQAGSSVTGSTN